MNTAPAKLPALRGIHWFVEAWRAALQKPLLWLPAALLVTAAHAALLMEFNRELVEIDGGPGAFMALVFQPVPHLSATLLLAALFSGAARRLFLPAFSGTPPLRRLLHALAFSALLAVALIGALFVWLLVYGQMSFVPFLLLEMENPENPGALFSIITIACTFGLAASGFCLTFWALLAQALAACGTPFFTALSRVARPALQPASLVHAAALAALSIAAIAMHDALTPNIPNTLLLALLAAAICAFALDALITPWLMARDMFKAAEE